MGCCLSKKQEVASSPSSLPKASPPISTSVTSSKIAAEKRPIRTQTQSNAKAENNVDQEEQIKKGRQEEGSIKKEIFVIKHRKSHDRERSSHAQTNSANGSASSGEETAKSADVNALHPIVRTSSCSKEEVDAILIHCGRLSRSNSSVKTASSIRKYSGSKRSYDFDHENDNDAVGTPDLRSKREGIGYDDDGEDAAERRQHRQRQRPSSRSNSQGRRRTPSRERDQQQQRSGSRERSSSSNGRRVSRSPGRRSDNAQQQDTPNPATRPGKMVSVPATVSSLAMDKSNNCCETNTVKRISVKRNVGAASPRSQSPARAHPSGANAGKGGHENQQASLSRSSSRKAEQSPYRRNPLSEIDPNSLAYPHSAANKGLKDSTNVINQATIQKQNIENGNITCGNPKGGSFSAVDVPLMEEPKARPPMAANVTVTQVAAESIKPQTITRSRSSRLSRDLDINPETLTNPNPSYTTLLLEDIQNFHQKNNAPQPSFSLPACVSKACSILEAVADLNSTTSSNLSTTFSEKGHNYKDPFVESEVAARDDLMEPSLHKYVTVRRGGGGDMDEQESSGSNSYAGGSVGQQHWGMSSSSWEPNSADSTDRWTSSSRSNTREPSSSEFARKTVNETRREPAVGRGRVGGSNKPLHTVPVAVGAAAASM